MRGNTKKDTSIELLLRRALFKRGKSGIAHHKEQEEVVSVTVCEKSEAVRFPLYNDVMKKCVPLGKLDIVRNVVGSVMISA